MMAVSTGMPVITILYNMHNALRGDGGCESERRLDRSQARPAGHTVGRPRAGRQGQIRCCEEQQQ